MQINSRRKTSRAVLAAGLACLLAALACGLPIGGIQPTAAVEPTSAVEPTAPAQVSEIRIYMIAVGDNGASGPPIGCGDSLIEVRRAVAPTTQPVRAALDTLLAEKNQYYGESGLYNALYQSNLSVQSVDVSADGVATVQLTGEVTLGGTCDVPRFKAQIVQTILSAGEIQWAEVFINGQTIDEVLSQK